MKCCLECCCEFHQGDTCPDCKGKNVIFERAEKEMYMQSSGYKFKCKMCGYTSEPEEKITCCPNCKWNVKAVDKFK